MRIVNHYLTIFVSSFLWNYFFTAKNNQRSFPLGNATSLKVDLARVKRRLQNLKLLWRWKENAAYNTESVEDAFTNKLNECIL